MVNDFAGNGGIKLNVSPSNVTIHNNTLLPEDVVKFVGAKKLRYGPVPSAKIKSSACCFFLLQFLFST